jgi:hypothetical protein
MSLTLCVLLWARPGAEHGLIAYEDQVIARTEVIDVQVVS